MKYEDRLGWCEEGQTYCSIAETEYKRIRDDTINECVRTIRNFAPDCVKLLEQLKEQSNENQN